MEEIVEEEIWKDIPGYDGLYLASTLGRIKITEYIGKKCDRIVKPLNLKFGYIGYSIRTNGVYKSFIGSRLIAFTFLGLDIKNKKDVVMHINDIPSDNRINNLKIGTQKENIIDCFNKKRRVIAKGENHVHSKKVNQYTKNGNFIKTWDCTRDIERKLNINNSGISRCCLGERPFAGGFSWKFCK